MRKVDFSWKGDKDIIKNKRVEKHGDSWWIQETINGKVITDEFWMLTLKGAIESFDERYKKEV